MTKREVVLDAIHHRPTPIVPYHLDLTDEVKDRLARELGDADFERHAGSYLVTERNESFTVLDARRERDMFGVVWRKDEVGDFGVVDAISLPEPALSGYAFPEPDEAHIRAKCERLTSPANRDLFKLYIIGFSLFERAWSLRGMENLLVDFLLNRGFVEELLDRIVEYNLAVADIAMQYPIDALFFGDDWGSQRGLIMGPELWREILKPRLAKMYRRVKERGLVVCQHSCGNIGEVFGDLIDIGLDIYNTFQPEIYEVDRVKREYGSRLTFYGGISTQRVLPAGTPDDVRAETRRMMRLMSAGGGYIVAPTHAIPRDVPTANILAFLETVRDQNDAEVLLA